MSQVWPVGWPFPQSLLHICPCISCRQDKFWIESFVGGLVSLLLHWVSFSEYRSWPFQDSYPQSSVSQLRSPPQLRDVVSSTTSPPNFIGPEVPESSRTVVLKTYNPTIPVISLPHQDHRDSSSSQYILQQDNPGQHGTSKCIATQLEHALNIPTQSKHSKMTLNLI